MFKLMVLFLGFVGCDGCGDKAVEAAPVEVAPVVAPVVEPVVPAAPDVVVPTPPAVVDPSAPVVPAPVLTEAEAAAKAAEDLNKGVK